MVKADIWDTLIILDMSKFVHPHEIFEDDVSMSIQGKQGILRLKTHDKPLEFKFKPDEKLDLYDLRMYNYTWKLVSNMGSEILIQGVLDEERLEKFEPIFRHLERSINGLKKEFLRFEERYGNKINHYNGFKPGEVLMMASIGEISNLVDSTVQLLTKDEITVYLTE